MFLIAIFSVFISLSQAFLIATGEPQNAIDFDRETDIYVIGYAGSLGGGFLKTATTLLHKSKEQSPDRQRILFVENRTKDFTSSKYVQTLGLHLILFDDQPMTSTLLMNNLLRFKKIKSLHAVTHGALENGLGVTDRDDNDGKWSHKTPRLSQLRFADDGYIVLHGCNTGFLQAPQFSKLIGVPVFGSLTATNFQQPFDDGQWYFHDKGLYPSDANFLTSSLLAFVPEEAPSCAQGACFRLKPDYFAYNGYWGDFSSGGGLSFLKAFCTFGDEQNIRDQKCLQAMAQWIRIYPSVISLSANSTLDDYKIVIKDFLCGVRLNHSWREDCFTQLEQSLSTPNMTYAGFRGNPLRCDNFGSCNVEYTCHTPSHTCKLKAPKNTEPRTIQQEYWSYLSAIGS